MDAYDYTQGGASPPTKAGEAGNAPSRDAGADAAGPPTADETMNASTSEVSGPASVGGWGEDFCFKGHTRQRGEEAFGPLSLRRSPGSLVPRRSGAAGLSLLTQPLPHVRRATLGRR